MSFPVSCQGSQQLVHALFQPTVQQQPSLYRTLLFIFVPCISFTQLSCNAHIFSVFHSNTFLLVLPCCSYPPLPTVLSVFAVLIVLLFSSSPAIVARAEECIWRSYPSCPRATWDTEKEEMLYILNSLPLCSSPPLIAIILCIFHSFTPSLLSSLSLYMCCFDIKTNLNLSHLTNQSISRLPV